MATLDLRGSNGTLRLGANAGSATIRPFLGIGPAGPVSTTPGPPGPSGPALPADQMAALSATYVRFRDLNGNPISSKVVTIVVDTATNEVSDIIVQGA